MNSILILFIIVVSLILNLCHCDWRLEWSDEFNGNSLDFSKWIVKNEITSCDGNHINQLNCNTNREKNLRVIDGTLVLIAINEEYLNKNFTSAMLSTKQSFSSGKFKIRAATPNGKLLMPSIYMNPRKYTGDSPNNGQIDIMKNYQTQKISSGIHYTTPPFYTGREYETNTNLNQFHTYTIEWNEVGIKWFFDETDYYSIDLNRKSNDLNKKRGKSVDNSFQLVLQLSVGGNVPGIQNQELTSNDVEEWNCSALLVDYVRIYNWINGTRGSSGSVDEGVSSTDICNLIIPLAKLPSPTYIVEVNATLPDYTYSNSTMSNKKVEFHKFEFRKSNTYQYLLVIIPIIVFILLMGVIIVAIMLICDACSNARKKRTKVIQPDDSG